MTGIELMEQERIKQKYEKGKTIGYDVEHNDDNQLTEIACALIVLTAKECIEASEDNETDPKFTPDQLKVLTETTEYKDRLIKAGALIAAELDRLMNIPKFPDEIETGVTPEEVTKQ